MKYAFDLMEIELEKNSDVGVLLMYGKKKGRKVKISLRPKNWFQRLISHQSALEYPNIVLTSMSTQIDSVISLIKIEKGCIKFTYSGLAFSLNGNAGGNYATKSTVDMLLSDLSKSS